MLPCSALVKFYLNSSIFRYLILKQIHVYNNIKDFIFSHLAAENDYLITGGNFKRIQAYGTVTITVDILIRKSKIKLSHVAFIPTFFINIVALSKAALNDIYFNLRRNLLY